MKRIALLIISLAVVATAGFCQKSALKKGNKKTKRGEYNEAIAYYQKALEDPSLKGETNFYIAEAFRLSNRIDRAMPYYEEAINSRYTDPQALFYYSFALKSDGKYSEAEIQLRRFLDIAEDPDLISRAQKELDNLSYLVVLAEKKEFL